MATGGAASASCPAWVSDDDGDDDVTSCGAWEDPSPLPADQVDRYKIEYYLLSQNPVHLEEVIHYNLSRAGLRVLFTEYVGDWGCVFTVEGPRNGYPAVEDIKYAGLVLRPLSVEYDYSDYSE